MTTTRRQIPRLILERLPEAVIYEQEHRKLPNVIHLQNWFDHTHKLCIRVGRSMSMDVVLDSRRVPALTSRNHVTFIWNVNEDQVLMKPTYNNTNGVFVNDVKMHHQDIHVLEVDDVISFGGPTHVHRSGRVDQNPVRYQVVQSSSTRWSDVFDEEASNIAIYAELVILQRQDRERRWSIVESFVRNLH